MRDSRRPWTTLNNSTYDPDPHRRLVASVSRRGRTDRARHALVSRFMTPLQFAKQECACFEPNGGCSGLRIADDLGTRSFGRKAKCLLADGKPCRYFEECVLPMGIEPSNARNVARSKERDEAVALYAKSAPGTAKSGRLCPECRKRELEIGDRYCYQCREDRQTAANARKNANRQKYTSCSKSHTDNQPLARPVLESPLSYHGDDKNRQTTGVPPEV